MVLAKQVGRDHQLARDAVLAGAVLLWMGSLKLVAQVGVEGLVERVVEQLERVEELRHVGQLVCSPSIAHLQCSC